MTDPHLPQCSDSADFSDEPSVPNPLLVAHRALRGRYAIAISLAVALALPAAIVAYKVVPVTYASVGLVEVQQDLPFTLYQIPENERLPDIINYAHTQADYLESRRVINLAATNQELRDAGWPTGEAGVLAIVDSLQVIPPRRGRTIRVEVNHTDPLLAQRGVNAVLDAYVEIHGASVGLSVSDKQRELTSLIQSLQRELQSSRDSAFRLADEFGADTLERRHLSKLDELDRYDAMIAQYEEALVIAQTQQIQHDDVDLEPDLVVLAAQDSQLSQLLLRREEMQSEQRSLSERFGKNHRSMKEIEANLRSLDKQVLAREAYLVELGKSLENAPTNTISDLDEGTIVARLTEFKSSREEMREQVRELGRRMRQIKSLDENAQETRTRLDDAQERLSRLEIEMRNNRNERVIIAQRGDIPLAPSSDKRLPAAAVAAMGAVGAAFALVFLYGFTKPTFRYIDEIESDVRSLRLLGTLPDYTSGDSAQRDLAAHSVHHIRNAMQLHATRNNIKLFTITSAAASDGKTSLVMSIGTSFATAGRRTVLVDCDFVGRGLSRALGVQDAEGFAQVCSADDGVRYIRPSGVPNLDVLPAGQVDHLDAARLSSDQVKPVLALLASRYDIVLIDTGPLLGSLEAGIVCTLCDSVILTVSCGQSMKIVSVAIEKLQRMQASCMGVIFNRASPGDFQHSTSHTSLNSVSTAPRASLLRSSTANDARTALMSAVAGTAAESTHESVL